MKIVVFCCAAFFPLLASGELQVKQSLLLDENFLPGQSLLWAPAFQKCWDETAKAVGWEDIPLEPETKIVRQLNSFEWDYEETVPGRSHFVFVSGTGESFREQANKLIKRHFGTAVPPLEAGYFDALLPPGNQSGPVAEMILLSILKHDLVFETSFEEERDSRLFVSQSGATKVTPFFGSWGAHRKKLQGAATILNYNSGANAFTVAFQGASPEELLILVQDESLKTIKDTVEVTRRLLLPEVMQTSTPLSMTDTLLIPKVKLDSFVDLAGQLRGVAEEGGVKLSIARAGQRIQLNLDQNGASMVTAAYVIPPTFLSTSGGGAGKAKQGRRLVFDRPFQLMLWRRGAEWPFLFARVDLDSLSSP
ncbi:hypothetical protein VSU19_22185 [Verrucomicrobiales bacterium BCK34]|nr:hypothetical protein [Verrucomicrobiales bacterium BCK34]